VGVLGLYEGIMEREDMRLHGRDLNSVYVSGLTRVEAGSNTSTVTLRVVRGDEMGLKKRPRHSLSG
jgi:hypothetical protein